MVKPKNLTSFFSQFHLSPSSVVMNHVEILALVLVSDGSFPIYPTGEKAHFSTSPRKVKRWLKLLTFKSYEAKTSQELSILFVGRGSDPFFDSAAIRGWSASGHMLFWRPSCNSAASFAAHASNSSADIV